MAAFGPSGVMIATIATFLLCQFVFMNIPGLQLEMIEMGRRAAKAVGATLAGVDLLTGKDGKTYVLEVNAVPGWKALAQTLGVDVGALVWDHLRTVAAENGRG